MTSEGKDTSDPSTGLWARSCEKETATPVEGVVKGSIPEWLNGRLIRNGAGERNIGPHSFNHLFDSMAMLHMVNIEQGKATYCSKFLRSDAYTTNHKANRIVFTEFGTVGMPDPCLSLYGKFSALFLPSFPRQMTDNCLVNVLQVKDQLIAMTELNTVRVVDPETLDTLPEKLKYSKYVTVQRATAHPHVDANNTVYNLGCDSSEGHMKYCILSLAEGKIENAKKEASVSSRWKFYPSYMHSFGMTENYFILVESPLCINILKHMLPPAIKPSLIGTLQYYNKENTVFRIISRKTGEEVQTNYLSPNFFNFHFSNCFEDEGNIVIDLCKTSGNIINSLFYDNIDKPYNDSTKESGTAYLTRYVLPIENLEDKPTGEELMNNVIEANVNGKCASAIKHENGNVLVEGVQISEDILELPRINYQYNMKSYSYTYCARTSGKSEYFTDFDSLAKVNVRTGETLIYESSDYYSMEPVFVSAPDASAEDDGVVIALLLHKFEIKKLSLVVLDAKTWKELAKVDFEAEGSVTSTFHGQFISQRDQYHAY